jgi:hypothetical protein
MVREVMAGPASKRVTGFAFTARPGPCPPRGRHNEPVNHLRVDASDLVGVVLGAFANTWPGLRLNLFDATRPDIYKDLSYEPYRLARERPLSERRGDIEIVGEMTAGQVRELLYRAYLIESDVDGLMNDETLDAASLRESGA